MNLNLVCSHSELAQAQNSCDREVFRSERGRPQTDQSVSVDAALRGTGSPWAGVLACHSCAVPLAHAWRRVCEEDLGSVFTYPHVPTQKVL